MYSHQMHSITFATYTVAIKNDVGKKYLIDLLLDLCCLLKTSSFDVALQLHVISLILYVAQLELE